MKPSAILNAYLFLSLILDGAALRSLWLSQIPYPIQALSTASFALKAAILGLEAREKRKYIVNDGTNRSPEETSGIFSQGLFWWLNSLLAKGFRQLLQPSDLYPIEPEMLAATLNDKFWGVWNQGTMSCSPKYYDPKLSLSSVL